jgi:hypothetical protein
MSPARRKLLMASAAAAAVVGSLEVAAAQGQPHTSETLRTESTGPQDPRSTSSLSGSSAPLSEKLESTGGVIRPPSDIAPSMAVRPPVPDPGTTPVIPPPGTLGGDPTVEPK